MARRYDARRSLQKLDLVLPKVGDPDTWPTDQVDFSGNLSYLDQAIRVTQHAQALAIAQPAGPVDRTLFWAPPVLERQRPSRGRVARDGRACAPEI